MVYRDKTQALEIAREKRQQAQAQGAVTTTALCNMADRERITPMSAAFRARLVLADARKQAGATLGLETLNAEQAREFEKLAMENLLALLRGRESGHKAVMAWFKRRGVEA